MNTLSPETKNVNITISDLRTDDNKVIFDKLDEIERKLNYIYYVMLDKIPDIEK